MKNILEKDIKIRYSQMDYNLMLKPSMLLDFLQELASDNAQGLHFGFSYISENNLAWYLLKYRIEFNDYPIKMYDLKITTEPRGYNKLFAFRDFEIYDKDKNLMARATSTWSLVDKNTKSLVPIQKALGDNPNMPVFEKRETDLEYQKLKPIERVDLEKTFEIRFDDIDVNKHANNTQYIVWALEPLDFKFRSEKKLKSLDIIYKKEVKYGAKVISQVQIDGNITNHILKSDNNEDLCLISASWSDIK